MGDKTIVITNGDVTYVIPAEILDKYKLNDADSKKVNALLNTQNDVEGQCFDRGDGFVICSPSEMNWQTTINPFDNEGSSGPAPGAIPE